MFIFDYDYIMNIRMHKVYNKFSFRDYLEIEVI